MYTPKYSINNTILRNIGIIEAAREVIDHAPLLPYYEKEFQKDGVATYVDDLVPGENAINVQLNEVTKGTFYIADPSKRVPKEYIRRLRKLLECVGVIPSASRPRGFRFLRSLQ